MDQSKLYTFFGWEDAIILLCEDYDVQYWCQENIYVLVQASRKFKARILKNLRKNLRKLSLKTHEIKKKNKKK